MLTTEQRETLITLKAASRKASDAYLDKFMSGKDDPELFAAMCDTGNAVTAFETIYGRDVIVFPTLVSSTSEKEVYSNGVTFTKIAGEWKMGRE